jgi:hypothetical protein
MPLSRLENFLKNIQGNVIYVNPEELDATDDVSNKGNSRTRPFRTIQRALLESARFSYQLGKDNDKFDKTTIVVSPGVHYIDNRPGYQIDTAGNTTNVSGGSVSINEFSVGSNFNIQSSDNLLYTFNSIHGGVIMPRGTSIVGTDLRKTKIRPKYVPDPANNNIPATALFRVTGGCYFREFTLFDGDPADRIFKDYTTNTYTPNFSHHKLTCFEYADGANIVSGKGNTDLDMYYAKLTLAYGNNSGRAIPSYPANNDFETVIDESRIVGAISQVGAIEIADIYSGGNPSSATATTVVSVVTNDSHGLSVGTPISIVGVAGSSNVNGTEYDGVHIVSQVLSDTLFTYSVTTAPATTATPNLTGLSPTVTVESDTVTSASPYIFNCSVRSVFGVNGLHADGAKASGFKSMVIAQFTGVSLNKDDTAFVKYNPTTGTYQDQSALGSTTLLHTDGQARHKPTYESFHIKASNSAQLQLVSTFAVGCGIHFVCDSGSDASITNSNSNFGAQALKADGFKANAFTKDDKGYITGILPTQRDFTQETSSNWLKLDVDKTAAASDTKLYLRDYAEQDSAPPATTGPYTVGQKVGELLKVNIDGTIRSAEVLMTVVSGAGPSGKKEHRVGTNAGISSITNNIITLQENHTFIPGESVRFYSDSGSLPDGIEYNTNYYVITDSLDNNQIQIATSPENAVANNSIAGLNNLGGNLRVVSDVRIKKPGEPGHPIQYNSTGWYINVKTGNNLHAAIVSNQTAITPETTRSYIERKSDGRKDVEKIYRLRYVLPDGSSISGPPQNGYSLEDTSSVIDDDKFQNDNTNLTSDIDLRQGTSIIDASWSSNVGVITSKFSHNLRRGQVIEINRLRSANNVSGADNSGFNGLFEVLQIDGKKTFRVGLNTNPGGISTITTGTPYTRHDQSVVGSGRTFSPYFVRKDYGNAYQVFNHEVVQDYKSGVQDGIYNLTMLGYGSIPEVSPYDIGKNRFAQNINDLRPNIDIDNYVDDPEPAVSYAVRDDIGFVQSNDNANSITRESTLAIIEDTGIGIGVTEATVSGTDISANLIVDHGFNSIKTVGSLTGGSNLGTGSGNAEFYFSVDLSGGTGSGATADVTVAAAGIISGIDIVDFGSGYSVNDVLSVKGVPFSASGTDATVTVTEIDNNVGDIIQVVGVTSTAYNGIQRITNVTDPKILVYEGTVSAASTNGFVYHVGVTTAVSNIVHDSVSGIATVTMNRDIGLRRGDEIVISGANSVYNGQFAVLDRIGYGSSLTVSIPSATSPNFNGPSCIAHGAGISNRSKGQTISIYGGLTTEISSGLTTASTSITLQDNNKIRRGDYLQIENEIVRISNNTKNQIIRGCLGTNQTSHLQYSAAVRIKVLPVEQRRHSVIRASGHTFEYVGYGPGNYSTALPQTQDRVLDDKQQLLAQSVSSRGGSVVYSGMNDRGEYFIGRKKIDALTGEEKSTINVFDSTGVTEIPSAIDFNDLTVKQNFYSLGNSSLVDIQLKGNRSGDVGTSVFVGINGANQNAPTTSVDQIILNTTFDKAGYIGWVRTTDSTQPWKKFGPISVDQTDHYSLDKLVLGAASAGSNTLAVTGDSSLTGDLQVSGAFTSSTAVVGSAKVSDLTTSRIVIVGASGELEDNSGLTFTGNTLTANTLSVTNNATVGGTCTADTFSGNGITPIGGIIMWSGGSVPSGWAICDGNNNTPNLKDRFVLSSGDTYSAGSSGGSADAVLVQHDHNATSTSTSTTQTETITGTFGSEPYSYAPTGVFSRTASNFGEDQDQGSNGQIMTMDASHDHTTTTTTTTAIANEGVSGTGKNLPPYYVLAFIMRTV